MNDRDTGADPKRTIISGVANQSLHALEIFMGVDRSDGPHQDKPRMVASTAGREPFPEHTGDVMLLCMRRIVDHSINS